MEANIKRGLKVIGIGILGIVILLVIIVLSSDEDGTRSPVLRIGDKAVFSSNKDGSCEGTMYAGTTKEAYDALVSAAVANDNAGIAELLLSGQVVVLKNCTSVQIIDSSLTTYRLRILDGINALKSVWTSPQFVKPLESQN